MLINETIKIKVYSQMIKYYKNLNYNVPFNGAEVEIQISDLPLGSGVKVNCVCDICGVTKKISYSDYMKSFNNGKYYTCQKCHHLKSEKTNFEKYGTEYISNVKEIKDKKRETCLKNWGVEYTLQHKDIQNKIKETKKEKYGSEKYYNINKYIETNLKNWGVKYYINSDDYKIKSQKTIYELYNCENVFQSEIIKEKSKLTNLDKYGFENPSQNDKIKDKKKETCLNNWGVEYPSQSKEIKEKIKQTCLKKYGVEYPSQNLKLFSKQQKNALRRKQYINLHYQGTYELDFLIKYYNQDLKNGPTIRFNFEDKNKIYFPDFYYEPLNLIIEIKSDYYYKKYLSKNLAKQKACLEQGYDFIFVINKDYSEFDKKLKVD